MHYPAIKFLDSLGPVRLRDELRDEIVAIGRDPEGRGTRLDEESDPEFSGLRYNVGVAGFAIFYIGPPERGRVYVTSIEPWDYALAR